MAKLFPGIFVAILAAIPGWIVGAVAASPNLLQRPLDENVAMFFRGTPIFLIGFGIVTLIYGSATWWLLRAFGALNFVTLVLAALLPIVVYLLYSFWYSGFDSGWHGPVLAFGIPAIFIAIAMWLFTVRFPL